MSNSVQHFRGAASALNLVGRGLSRLVVIFYFKLINAMERDRAQM